MTSMPLYSVVDSRLTLSQKIRPGSALSRALRMSWSQSLRARTVFSTRPTTSFSKRSVNASSRSTARMNSSVTRTLTLAYWTLRRSTSFLMSIKASTSG